MTNSNSPFNNTQAGDYLSRVQLKNSVISTLDKFIIFLGRTFSGRTHDYTMLKEELPPEMAWFAELNFGYF